MAATAAFTGAITSAPGNVSSTWYATALVTQSVHDARAQASLFSSTRVAVTMAQETARSVSTALSTVLTAIARLSPASGAGGSGKGNGQASRTVAGAGSGSGSGPDRRGRELSFRAARQWAGPRSAETCHGATTNWGMVGADSGAVAPLAVVPLRATGATGSSSGWSRNGTTTGRSAPSSGDALVRSVRLPRDPGSTARYWSAGHHAHASPAARAAPRTTAPTRLRGDPSVAAHTLRTVRRTIRLSRYPMDSTGSATRSTDSSRTTTPARSPSDQ